MSILLGLALLVAVEVVALVAVADRIGVFSAIGLLVLISACGPWLVRRAGFGVWRRARARLAGGGTLEREALDGMLLLAAGLLICVPGFVTDVAGLLLLVPPVRAAVGRRIKRRASQSLLLRFSGIGGIGGLGGMGRNGGFGVRRRGAPPGAGDVLDAATHPATHPTDAPADPPELPTDMREGGPDDDLPWPGAGPR